MTEPLLECVPNFSEGGDMAAIDGIAAAVASVAGVTLLDVDPGRATNRTVVTFVGPPQAVIEAAVRAGKASVDFIDMARHQGEHPRFGAMDVCPLVPVSGITMAEAADHARELGRRLGDEAGLTVYLYEHAASAPHRRNLAAVRAGEYEGLPTKLRDPAWQPDFGPATFNSRSGATAVGARDFLIAYNINLNTTSVRRANAIAFDVREKGRLKRSGDPLTGEVVRGPDGEPEWVPGTLKTVKAIGWYIEEYGIAQISMNLTDISVTSIHAAFDEVVEKAAARGIRVTGSELVGLIPLRAMLDAGRHYLTKQRRSHGVSDAELIKIAVKSLGLDDLEPFDPGERIIEYRLMEHGHRLVDRTVNGFVHEVASESVAPGGGSAAALAGALGAALGTMVANLSAHRRGWDDRWAEFSEWAVRGKQCHDELLRLVDADTEAFQAIVEAHRLPTDTGTDRNVKADAVEAATRRAIEVPLRVMAAGLEAMEVVDEMARRGPESSVSDAGVGAVLCRAAVRGAALNVRINAAQLDDPGEALDRAADLEARAREREEAILEAVAERL
jgi:glutamate formiminotransferase/formiminotetrahydrofolate cyclodeaminase